MGERVYQASFDQDTKPFLASYKMLKNHRFSQAPGRNTRNKLKWYPGQLYYQTNLLCLKRGTNI